MAKNEIKYLQSVTHPNIIKIFSSEIDDITQKAYMLLDWLPVSAFSVFSSCKAACVLI